MNTPSRIRSPLGRAIAGLTHAALATALLGPLGCAQEADEVFPFVDLIDRAGESFNGSLRSMNGTYGAGCTDRAGAWSVAIDAGAALTNPELSVVLNDSGCLLTLTSLLVDSVDTAASPSIALGTSYKVSPSSFGSPVNFYANAKLSTVDFEDDFVLTILYSDDPANATDDNTAAFEVVTSSAVAAAVDAPDYTLDVSGISVQTDADDVVQAASGDAVLTSGSVAGQTYVVVESSGLATYGDIDAAYLGTTPAAIGASLPADDFTLVGSDLTDTQLRTLIIANASEGVRSYQTFEITFHPAL